MNAEQRATLRKLAEGATPGPWMRLFGERTVYDRMEDGCRGNVIVRADHPHSKADGENLDYIAAANPSAILQLLDYIETLEKDAAQQRTAEACAKAVERLISGDGICADNEVWIHDCADAIRRGDWRDHL